MPLAILVVDRHAALQESAQIGRIEGLLEPGVIERLRLVEQEAPIAVGARHQCVSRWRGQGERALKRFRPLEQAAQRLVVQAPKDQDLRPAQKRSVESEAGVFRRRTHQRHRAAFDEGQEAVLLRAVEAVDLVHE